MYPPAASPNGSASSVADTPDANTEVVSISAKHDDNESNTAEATKTVSYLVMDAAGPHTRYGGEPNSNDVSHYGGQTCPVSAHRLRALVACPNSIHDSRGDQEEGYPHFGDRPTKSLGGPNRPKLNWHNLSRSLLLLVAAAVP